MKKAVSILMIVFLVAQLFAPVSMAYGNNEQRVSLPLGEIVRSLPGESAPMNPLYYYNNYYYYYRNPRNGLREAPFQVNTNADLFGNDGRMYARNLPSSFDLRNNNKVSPIRDQGPNGSCWAFATYASLESTFLPDEVYDFSEKHLRNTHGFDWKPDEGGNSSISAAYLARWSGPIDEKDDPYDPYNFYSPKDLDRIVNIDEVYFINDTKNADFRDIVKEALMDYGAMYTTISGDSRYFNDSTNAHYEPSYGVRADHAVTIVGWDDNYSKTNFLSTPQGNGAWIVRNSWGETWGDKGYYYVSYYDKYCGKNNAVYIGKDMEDSQEIWYHDPFGMTDSYGNGETGYFANIFGPADEAVEVNEVGFFVPSNGAKYEVYVSSGLSDKKGLNDRKLVASGTLKFAGYTTVDIEPVRVEKGKYFAPIIKLTTPGYNYPIPVEARVNGYASGVRASYGQSFISYDGATWTDMTNESSNTNVCVKAMTVPAEPVDEILVEDIKINAEKTTLKVGETLKLNANVSPGDATDKSLTWSSSDNRVVSVDSEGLITALKEGRARIYAKANDSSYKEAWIEIEVAPKDVVLKELKIDANLTPEVPQLNNSLGVRISVKDNSGRYMPYTSVYATLTKPDGQKVNKSAYTNYYGSTSFYFYSSDMSQNGKYSLDLTARYQGYNDATEKKEFTIGAVEPVPVEKEIETTYSVKKDTVKPGETFEVDFSSKSGNSPLGYVNYKVKYYDPRGSVVTETNVFQSDYKGDGYSYFTPSSSANTGKYKFVVTTEKEGYKSSSVEGYFNVEEEEEVPPAPPANDKITTEIQLDKPAIYSYSGSLKVTGKVYDAEGNIITNAPVRFTVEWPNGRSYTYVRDTGYYGSTEIYLSFYSSYPKGIYKIRMDYTGNLGESESSAVDFRFGY